MGVVDGSDSFPVLGVVKSNYVSHHPIRFFEIRSVTGMDVAEAGIVG